MLLSHLIRNIYMNESTIPDIAINEMYHVDLWTLLNEDPEQGLTYMHYILCIYITYTSYYIYM